MIFLAASLFSFCFSLLTTVHAHLFSHCNPIITLFLKEKKLFERRNISFNFRSNCAVLDRASQQAIVYDFFLMLLKITTKTATTESITVSVLRSMYKEKKKKLNVIVFHTKKNKYQNE